jgi:ribosomal protein S12 methylthiotransferase
MDLYGEPRLAELLQQLDEVEGIDWIRLMYFYPMYITDELVDVLANAKKILPYIDMPLQHINDNMLRRMSRRVTREQTEALIQKLRNRIPELTLRTTLITGFPGETEAEFAELVEFVQQQKFDHMGVFTYSFEADTPSGRLAEHLSEEIKEDRRERLMAAQQPIAFERGQAHLGRQMDIILDQPVAGEDNVWVGRSKADAPDVDGVIYVTGGEEKLAAGDIVLCEIVASQEYDLVAVAIGVPF